MGNPIHPFPFSKLKPQKNINRTQTNHNPEVAPMGWPNRKTVVKTSSEEQVQKPTVPTSPLPSLSLVEPELRRKPHRPGRGIRLLRSFCRTLPVFTPRCNRVPGPCKMISNAHIAASDFQAQNRISSSSSAVRVTGTLFGNRRGRVSFSLQQNSRCLPTLVIELAIQTQMLLREIGSGMVRIALECEKQPDQKSKDQLRLLDEPLWTMYCNGKKCGYGVRREASDQDLSVMETLCPMSMGVGVLPGGSETEGKEGEVAYVRSYFEHVVGSRDSETMYMVSPDGQNGPELTIFFVRI
ncbi:hypothetical protein LUZ62_025400 [Rhynchospora pubera]|uniref:Protein MIZU-KUSSEI 1-like n=1 Tax=Rhynchospora pubera TaxID=906938 RepID=A0AAV8CZD5_9POAL|nr:hypothetical protein LUZ62_070741 [Rhynchospora pubera]KAJ4812834.1 hypothetical protein LUZ62_025400 [Rhynchospora pubera]